MEPRKPLLSSLAGLVAGAVALIIITAILAAAVSSLNTNDKAASLLTRIEAVQARQEAQGRELASQEDARRARSQALMAQNAQLRAELASLAQFLRKHGFTVPRPPTSHAPQQSSPSAVPKAPRRTPHHSPGSPAPTEPSPRRPGTPSPSQPVPPCPLIICVSVPSGLPTLF